MKIKVLSNDNARFTAIKRAIVAKEPSAEVLGGLALADEMHTYVNGSAPEVVIVDAANQRSLEAVEALNLRRPDIDTLLISSESSVDFLMRAMRAGVREVIPQPAPEGALESAIDRILQKRYQSGGHEHAGKVLAFISCKGGSGATFLASNLAYLFAAEQGKRVALIDLNLQFGDALMFVSDHRAPSNIAEVAQEISRLDASLLNAAMLEAAPNFCVLAAPDDPSHAADVRREHIEAIIKVARRQFDVVVIDAARTLDAVTLQALDMADHIFPVVQLTLPFVRDSKRLISVFRSLDYSNDKVRLLVNRYQKGGEISVEDLEHAVGGKVYKTIPNSYAAAASSVNLGIPIAKTQRSHAISKVLAEMAQELHPAEATQGAAGGWLSRMFARA